MPYNREYLKNAAKNFITKHITMKDVCYSDTALRLNINNIPSVQDVANAKLLAENILEPIIYHYGKHLLISNIYRSPLLNKAVGGSVSKITGKPTSEHCYAQACDFTIAGISTKQIFNDIISGRIKKDGNPIKDLVGQCIHETDKDGSWIHISYNKNRIRKMFMTSLFGVFKNIYKEL